MAETITLYDSFQATMASSWTDTVYLTLRKDGKISIQGKIYGDDPDTGRPRTYRMEQSKAGISSPEELISILRSIEEDGRFEMNEKELINTLDKIDKSWSLKTSKYLYCDDD